MYQMEDNNTIINWRESAVEKVTTTLAQVGVLWCSFLV